MDELLLLSRYFYHRPSDLRKILEEVGTEKIMAAPKDAFLKIGISGKALDDFIEARSQKAESRSDTRDVKAVTIFDKEYPAALKNIYDAPPIMFYRGELGLVQDRDGALAPQNSSCKNEGEKPRIAVVGSRKMSEYGRRAAEEFVKDLALHFIVVSGLAFGIDSFAHEVALRNGGGAIAVLGSGLGEKDVYTKSNLFLAKKILESGGLLLSEIPPGVGPQKFHFPMRNRIIAGLARGILIIEAGEKSGTLITARFGLESGADIFAVPNNIFYPNAGGVNYLIKCGAHPVTAGQDILDFYGIKSAGRRSEYAPKNALEKIILDGMDADGLHMDEIKALTKTEIANLIEALTDLEMAGVVKNIGGKYTRIQKLENRK